MRIEVTGKHLTITDAIRLYAESKAEKLLKIWDGVQEIRVILEAQNKKNEFRVEVAVDVVKHEDFISHADAGDLYACIDMAVDKSMRQLRDHKEKLRE